MVFSSLTFIFIFLPIFLILYYFGAPRSRNMLLFIGSLIFYGMGEPYYLFLILLSIFVNYGLGRLIALFYMKKRQKTFFLLLALLYDFGLLLLKISMRYYYSTTTGIRLSH